MKKYYVLRDGEVIEFLLSDQDIEIKKLEGTFNGFMSKEELIRLYKSIRTILYKERVVIR